MLIKIKQKLKQKLRHKSNYGYVFILVPIISTPVIVAQAMQGRQPQVAVTTPPVVVDPNNLGHQYPVSAPATPPDNKQTPPAAAAGATKPPKARTPSPAASSAVTSQPPPPASTPPAPTPPPVQNLYQVNEQFAGSSLNDALWQPMTYPKGARNKEEQDYRPSQVQVADGNLEITANRDASGDWHSGEIHSKWSYTYGEFEVRMALSTVGQGIWPTVWLMGTTDSWPHSGEIDVFENTNGSDSVFNTIHGSGSAGHWQIQNSYSPIDITQYHTYKIVKKPNVISWWVDGVKRGERLKSQMPAGGIWPFENHKNFAILDLAIGGTWPGPSDASTPSTVKVYVDYFTVKNGS